MRGAAVASWLFVGFLVGLEYGILGTSWFITIIGILGILYVILQAVMSYKRAHQDRAWDIYWNKHYRKPDEKPRIIHPFKVYWRRWWRIL